MQKGKANMGAEDLCGKRFGKLTVLRKTEQKRKGSFLWLCECECGNTILLERYKIERGLVQSCGCARKGKNTKDLKGMRIGHLQVVRRLDEKKGSCYLWECVRLWQHDQGGDQRSDEKKSGAELRLCASGKRYRRTEVRKVDGLISDGETSGRKYRVDVPVRLRQCNRSFV